MAAPSPYQQNHPLPPPPPPPPDDDDTTSPRDEADREHPARNRSQQHESQSHRDRHPSSSSQRQQPHPAGDRAQQNPAGGPPSSSQEQDQEQQLQVQLQQAQTTQNRPSASLPQNPAQSQPTGSHPAQDQDRQPEDPQRQLNRDPDPSAGQSRPPQTANSGGQPKSGLRGRGFSFRAAKPPVAPSAPAPKDHSHSHSQQETHAEKEAKRIQGKADPTLAMMEAEPSTVAAMQSITMTPIRAIQHRDVRGNIIADPDRSNPTRSRWERPLETIMSFERQIDMDYNRKSMMVPSDVASMINFATNPPTGNPPMSSGGNNNNANRSSSYFGPDSRRGPLPAANPPQNPSGPSIRDSFQFRPQSTQFELGPPTARNSVYQHGDPGPSSGELGYGPRNSAAYGGGGAGRMRAPRASGDGQQQQQQPGRGERDVYALQHKDRSYETVTSAAASGNSDQAGYTTDPTSGSENSSIDRPIPDRRPALPMNDYGIGFSQPSTLARDDLALSAPAVTPAASVSADPAAIEPAAPAGEAAMPSVLHKRRSLLHRGKSTASSNTDAGNSKRPSWLKRLSSRRDKQGGDNSQQT